MGLSLVLTFTVRAEGPPEHLESRTFFPHFNSEDAARGVYAVDCFHNTDTALQALISSLAFTIGQQAAAPGAVKPQTPSPAPPPQQSSYFASPPGVVNGIYAPPSRVLPNSYAAFELTVYNMTVDQFTPAAQQLYIKNLANYFANDSFSSIAILRIDNSSHSFASGPAPGGQSQVIQPPPVFIMPPSGAAGPIGFGPQAMGPWPHRGHWSGHAGQGPAPAGAFNPQQSVVSGSMSGNPGAPFASGPSISAPAPAPLSSRRLLQQGNNGQPENDYGDFGRPVGPAIHIYTVITLPASVDRLLKLSKALEDTATAASFIGPNQAPGTVFQDNEFI